MVSSRKGHSDQQSAWTDANGNFSFSGIDIHKNSKYAYSIYIEDKNRYLSKQYGHSGLDPIELDKDKILEPKQLGVIGSFSRCILSLPPGVFIAPPDSFTLRFQQPVLHGYEPNRIYEAVFYPRNLNTGTGSSAYSPSWGDYPMGMWHITFDKIKNGLHTVTKDSIYLDMGEVTTYQLPW